MTHFLRKMAAAWIILGSVSVGFAQQQMPPIPTDPNVRIGKLDNGLTYYIRHNELPEKKSRFLHRSKSRFHFGRRQPARLGTLLRTHVL